MNHQRRPGGPHRPSGRPRPDHGSIRPTGAAAPVGAGCLGLLGGWAIRPLSLQLGWTTPEVSWLQVLVLVFVAGVIAITAWVTWRELQVRGQWLEPHRAVNRLLMAKSCIVVGALLAGGYAGYAVSWLGIDAELADQRMARAASAALVGLVITGVAIWLERACRVRNDDDADLA
ncbi:DUF3180 domain-containing protein [Nocardioides cavernaquae]|uniref:DUF3180 domain-containing protein n=1 Tax=Nocardioides cavernaquae TaxID=2321396 RepID=UPI001EE5BBA9|nr:DUF3180 domain-containing protein [Nocardioides cavernaquae]